jgi:uncharacterized membrane protein
VTVGGPSGPTDPLPTSSPSTDDRPADVPVPFAGLRRHARALGGGLAILLVLFLLPDLAPRVESAPQVDLVHGRIVELHATGGDPTLPDVSVVVLDGARAGEVLDGYLQGPAGQLDVPDYAVGEEVVVSVSAQPDGSFVAVSDRWRVPALALIVGLFALAVTLVGGWRGVRSLLALVLTMAVVIKVVLPLILLGYDPVLVAVGAATVITVVTLLLTEGLRRSTAAAALGTFSALALTAALALAFSALARFTDIQGAGDAVYLRSLLGDDLDLRGLVLAAVILGSLGVLDDVTITQAATVSELHEADPRVSPAVLVGRAMNVGRSHIAATVNTLVLAYVGAALPLLVLFAAGAQDPVVISSGEIVAVEVVRALAGSIGIVAAVPITTLIAVGLVGRRLPVFGDGSSVSRAPGWE